MKKVPFLKAGMELEEIASLQARIAAEVMSCLLIGFHSSVKSSKIN